MSIKDLWQKIKGWGSQKTFNFQGLSDDLFLGLILVLVASGSFGLGRLSKIESSKTPIRIENGIEFPEGAVTQATQATSKTMEASIVDSAPSQESGQFVASKSGTKYHYPWCSGAKTISPANKIYFNTKAEAEAQGYTPASNCKGL